jgi:hypothetical protein
MTSGTQPDFLSIVISREDIEAGDISSTVSCLKQLLNPEATIRYCEKVDIGVYGYDDYAGELNELPEIRDFVYNSMPSFHIGATSFRSVLLVSDSSSPASAHRSSPLKLVNESGSNASVDTLRNAAFQPRSRSDWPLRFAPLDDGKRCFWAQALDRRRSFTQSDVDF